MYNAPSHSSAHRLVGNVLLTLLLPYCIDYDDWAISD
jgi:hypothetical protein